MPYRRLPNTDTARYRAMNCALEKAQKDSVYDSPLSPETLRKLQNTTTRFGQYFQKSKEVAKQQLTSSKEYNNIVKKAKLYISHFIQVLNFAILRGELNEEVRKFYGLDLKLKKVPTLNSEQEIIFWGEKIISGEKQRIANGGNPVTNPGIALVNVNYERFLSVSKHKKSLQMINTRTSDQVSEMRKEVDKLILRVWNEIEAKFSKFGEEIKREKSAEYGVKYVFRKTEKNTNLSNSRRKALEKNTKKLAFQTSLFDFNDLKT